MHLKYLHNNSLNAGFINSDNNISSDLENIEFIYMKIRPIES